jgi:hypothetical protein
MIPAYDAGEDLEQALRPVPDRDPGPDRRQVAAVDDASPGPGRVRVILGRSAPDRPRAEAAALREAGDPRVGLPRRGGARRRAPRPRSGRVGRSSYEWGMEPRARRWPGLDRHGVRGEGRS